MRIFTKLSLLLLLLLISAGVLVAQAQQNDMSSDKVPTKNELLENAGINPSQAEIEALKEMGIDPRILKEKLLRLIAEKEASIDGLSPTQEKEINILIEDLESGSSPKELLEKLKEQGIDEKELGILTKNLESDSSSKELLEKLKEQGIDEKELGILTKNLESDNRSKELLKKLKEQGIDEKELGILIENLEVDNPVDFEAKLQMYGLDTGSLDADQIQSIGEAILAMENGEEEVSQSLVKEMYADQLPAFGIDNIVFTPEVIYNTDASGTVTLGEGTTYNGTSGHPTPYGTYWKNLRQQYLILASELSSLGLLPGNITALGFNVQNVNTCSAMPNYTMKMKGTTVTELTSTFDNGTYTTVWTDANYLPIAGWNTHTFTTPFVWNGTDNVIIDVCFDIIPGSWTQNASVYYTETIGTNMAAYYRSDSEVACGTALTASGVSPNRANMQITGELADCLPPAVLTASNITVNSADLNWTPVGTETLWDLEWGEAGFDPGTGAGNEEYALTSASFPLFGLDELTSYDVWVRANCGTKEESSWAGPENFQTLANPLSGTYTINSGSATGGSNFNNFTDFAAALNLGGLSGSVIANVVTGTGPYTEQVIIGDILNSSASNTVTVNGNGEKLEYLSTASAERATLKLNGSDYFTFDNLIIEALGSLSGEYGYAVQLMNEADNNTFTDCEFIATQASTLLNFAAFVASNSATSPTTTGLAVNSLTVDGCITSGGYYGMSIQGPSVAPWADNNTITNNEIKDFYYYGLYLKGHNTSLFSENEISRPTRTTVSTGYMIYLYYDFSGSEITKNSIFDFAGNTTTASAAYGIYGSSLAASVGSDLLIANNSISGYSNMNSSNYGIYLFSSGDCNLQIYHNTVSVDNQTNTGSSTVYAFYHSGSGAVLDLKNNIFAYSSTSTGTKYCMYFSGFPPTQTVTSDYNVLYPGSSTGTNNTGSWNAAFLTLADWQTANGGIYDLNSAAADPLFVNPSTGDLTPASAAIDDMGTDLLSIVPDDINGVARTTTPDPGAYEFDPPSCPQPSLIPVATVTSNSAVLEWTENGGATTWDIEVVPTGTPPTGTPTASGIMDNPYTYLGLDASTTYDYYVRSVCSVFSSSIWSGPGTFTTACATYTPDYTEDFTTFVPVCWDEADSGDATSGPGDIGASPWQNSTVLGAGSARINLYDDFHSDWLLSPSFDLSAGGYEVVVDVAVTNWNSGDPDVMGSDDAVQLLYTEDGITWTNITTWTVADELANTPTAFNFALTSTGTNVQFGIFATDGPIDDLEDYDFHVDNFTVQTPPACPAPSSLTETGIGLTEATLGWTENGSATTWEYEYGVSPYTFTGTGTSTTDPTPTITGLTPDVTYDWGVRADCGGGSFSTWVTTGQFTTHNGVATNPSPADGATDVALDAKTFDWDDVLGADSYTIDIGTATGLADIVDDGVCAGNTYTYTGADWDALEDYFWTVTTLYTAKADVVGDEWNFTTGCAIYTPDYTENFTTFVPACWDLAASGDETTGPSGIGSGDWYSTTVLGTGSAKINLFYISKSDWLLSPDFDLSAGGYQVVVDVAVTDYNGSTPDVMGSDDAVQLLYTEDGITWTNITTWTVADALPNSPTAFTFALTSTGANVQFGILATDGPIDDGEDYDFHVDNFTVQTPPACPAPSALIETGIGLTEATLGWTENGSATTWEYEYGISPYTFTGTGTSTTDPTPTITGLTPDVTYDWGVRADCEGANGTSTWITTGQFTTHNGVATNPNPANGATDVALTAKTFDWDDVLGADSYTIDIGTATGLADIVDDGVCASSTYTYTGADWDGLEDYFWTVTTLYTAKADVVGDEWSFTTACATYTPDYTEDFTTFVPACWDEADSGDATSGPGDIGASPWQTSTALGTGSARVNLYDDFHSDWLLSPSFDLSAGGYEVVVDVAVTNWNSGDPDVMGSDDAVQLLYTEDGTTWINITTWTVADALANTPTTFIFALTSTGANVQFGILATDGPIADLEDYDFHVDKFTVQTPPACPAPSALTETGIGLTEATLGWTENGSATTWEYEYGVSPYTFTGTGTSTTDQTPTITGLTLGTTYDWGVRADCGGASGTSIWVTTGQFTTHDGIATNPSPADGASGVALAAKTFDWDDVPGADNYTIDIGTATGLADIVDDGVCATSTYTYTGADWDELEDYFWTVTTLYTAKADIVGNEWSFTTACASVTAPFVENFQATTIPDCWTISGPQNWLFTTTWLDYGADAITDHTGTGGSFAGVDGSGISDITGITLLTPTIDLSLLIEPQLRFFLFNNNVDTDDWQSLSVDLWDGTAWNNGIYVWGPTDNNPNWVEIEVPFTAYTITGDIQVRFVVSKSTGSPYYDDLIIDDVFIEEVPSCPNPIDLGVANVTATGADLTWTSFSGFSHIEFGLTNFVPTGIPTYEDVTSPYTIGGLSSSIAYDFYVMDSCGVGDISGWVGPFTFVTSPGTHMLPLLEDFESGFSYFDNDIGNGTDWTLNTSYFNTGVQCAHNAYDISSTNVLHETGILDLSGETDVLLDFWHIAKSEGDYDHCYVEISTDGGQNYETLPITAYLGAGVYDTPTGNLPTGPCFDEDAYVLWGTASTDIPDNATWWQNETFSLNDYLTTNVRIRFRLHSDFSVNAFGWLLDDVAVYAPSNGYTIDGTITYANGSMTPLNSCTIELYDNTNTLVSTSSTDAAGYYEFTDIPDGDYTLETSSAIAWGGLTMNDVNFTRQSVSGGTALTGLHWSAAEVTWNGSLDMADVLLLRQRVANNPPGTVFVAPNWIVETQNVIVSGGNVTNDYQGICSGDADGSYVPPVSK